VYTYTNGKIRPVEIISGMEEGRLKENDEGGECKYILYIL
jgi:hypothetical protein